MPSRKSKLGVSSFAARNVADPVGMRALAHPVRLALLEALGLYGPMTATVAGERIGESPTTCSFHLRQLAKYGFVEEAGGGKGRARPWRMTSMGLSVRAGDDRESQMAAEAFARLVRQRISGRYRAWLEGRGAYPPEWRKAAGESEFVLYLTAAELQALNQELVELLRSRYQERMSDPAARPDGARPVEMFMVSYPIEGPPPQAGT